MTSARQSAALQPPANTRRTGRIRSETISTAAIFALAIILILASRFVSPALGSWDQVDTIITLASFLIVVAFGQGLVILVGGLDLSVASMITLGGVLATTWNGSLGSEWVLIPAVLLICACVGGLNAVGAIWLNIPPFIMTMASGIIVASTALGYTSGTPRGASPEAFLALMKGSVGPVSAVLIFVLIFVLLAWALQSATAFGRRLYAVGANREAARIAGVATWRPIMAAYSISAVCAGFVGMMLVGYANGATLRMGDSYLLPSIAAVVIGGSSNSRRPRQLRGNGRRRHPSHHARHGHLRAWHGRRMAHGHRGGNHRWSAAPASRGSDSEIEKRAGSLSHERVGQSVPAIGCGNVLTGKRGATGRLYA